jgi:hypothetical protein
MNEPLKHSEESTLQFPPSSMPTVGIFGIDNKHGLEDHAFLVLSWSREQEH